MLNFELHVKFNEIITRVYSLQDMLSEDQSLMLTSYFHLIHNIFHFKKKKIKGQYRNIKVKEKSQLNQLKFI